MFGGNIFNQQQKPQNTNVFGQQQQAPLFGNQQTGLGLQQQNQPATNNLFQPQQQQQQQTPMFPNQQQQLNQPNQNLFQNQQQPTLFQQPQQQNLQFPQNQNLGGNQNLFQQCKFLQIIKYLKEQQPQNQNPLGFGQVSLFPQQGISINSQLKDEKQLIDSVSMMKKFVQQKFFEQTINSPGDQQCLFKTEFYDEIRKYPQVDSRTFWSNQYIPQMPAETWHYMQNQNPDPYRFFVNYEFGFEKMSEKYQQKSDKLQEMTNQMQQYLKKVNEIKQQTQQVSESKLKELNEKNILILNKILQVHNLVEKIAIKYNAFNCNSQDEVQYLSVYKFVQMKVFQKLKECDQMENQYLVKLEDIKPKLLETVNQERNDVKDKFFEENEKKNEKMIILDLLTQMKNGINVLSKMSERDQFELKNIEQFLQNQKI